MRTTTSEPVLGKVDFVGHDEDDHVRPPLGPDVLDPLVDGEEGLLARHVEANHRHRAIPDVARDQRAKPLLPSRVPQLEPDRSVVVVKRLRNEVDPHCRLTYFQILTNLTWSFPSNVSNINLLMMEVFPTD